MYDVKYYNIGKTYYGFDPYCPKILVWYKFKSTLMSINTNTENLGIIMLSQLVIPSSLAVNNLSM